MDKFDFGLIGQRRHVIIEAVLRRILRLQIVDPLHFTGKVIAGKQAQNAGDANRKDFLALQVADGQ